MLGKLLIKLISSLLSSLCISNKTSSLTMESWASSVPRKAPPPLPSSGNLVTVLSIDGGGVRGIIPAVILRHLEKELQECAKDPNVRIADYFDVVAGTSTGGIITAMLTAPDHHHPNNMKRPMFTASEIVEFYKTKSATIFPQGFSQGMMKIIFLLRSIKEALDQLIDQIINKLPRTMVPMAINKDDILKGADDVVKGLVLPRYDAKPLSHILEDELGNLCLRDTLTNVVIPTFDMKQLAPTIFSSFRKYEVPALDAKLSDICLGTSAAPTFFPPHFFENEKHEFHLIDGALSANNPGLAAISELTLQKTENPKFLPMMNNPNDYKKFLMISLGCGTQPKEHTYNARNSLWWGVLQWIGPLMEFYPCGSQCMVDYHLATVFRGAGQAEDHYLRIQDDGLTKEMAEMDNSSKKNLNNLETYAKELLNKPVKRMNTQTFEYEPVADGTTNAQALKWIAEKLHEEKQNRLQGNRSV